MAERRHMAAVALSVALHAVVLSGVWRLSSPPTRAPDAPTETQRIVLVDLSPPPPPFVAKAPPPRPLPAEPTLPPERPDRVRPAPVHSTTSNPDQPRASMAAPPAPTDDDWALASTYSLKNSKRYRHTWGQQVRSMMGTAVEGPDQGLVRFRIEIAPDGTLARLETLWSTSDKAESLARKAVETMPRLPPTPTGKPLIFEKTISFQPFDADGPPIYKNDCIPDRPVYRNPFAWDGKSPQVRAAHEPAATPDAQAMAECLKQLPQDSVEAESAHNQRQLEQWGASRLNLTEVPRK